MRDVLVVNARLATMRAGRYSLVERGAMHVRDGRILRVCATEELRNPGGEVLVVDAHGAVVTPGLVDCHTHLVYAGNRALEFEARLRGASYEEIARAGGGILRTVRETRAATEKELRRQAAARLAALAREGVTTVEIKSGYGLDLDSELKCLRVARSLGSYVHVSTTLLAAHAVPPEFKDEPDLYVAHVCEVVIPAAAREGLANAVDAFCERIAFSAEQTRKVLAAATAAGLRVKLHADQLSNGGGAALAAEFRALSADHLEHTDEPGVMALASAGTVAVLLPGAFYFLRETKRPPIALLRKHGVPIAVATDCNPGTSPITSATAILNMACTLFELTPEEALAGMTCHAARALGLESEVGTLDEGKRADFVVWECEHPAEISAQIGMVGPRAIYVNGEARG